MTSYLDLCRAGRRGHSSSAAAGQLQLGPKTCRLRGRRGPEAEETDRDVGPRASRPNTNTRRLLETLSGVLIRGLKPGVRGTNHSCSGDQLLAHRLCTRQHLMKHFLPFTSGSAGTARLQQLLDAGRFPAYRRTRGRFIVWLRNKFR